MNNLEIISLTKAGLKQAITQNKFWSNTYKPPFSINKANWLLENNRADDNDILAILGYDNYNIIAFVHLVPDFVKGEQGALKKIFWSQRWWAADKYKETVLPTYVKKISLNECDNQAIIKFFGDKTKAYYEKQPYAKFSERTRNMIIFNLDHNILISKKNSLKKIKNVLKFLDSLSIRIISLINKRKSDGRTKKLTYKYVSSINKNHWSFIKKHCANDIVPKTLEYINWQISNMQYHVIKDKRDKPQYDCLLNSVSSNIYNLNFMIEKEHKTIGFVSGLVRGNSFFLRYFLSDKINFDQCADALMVNFIKSKCTLLQTDNSNLIDSLNSYLNVYKDSKPLVSLVHDNVDLNLKDFIVNDRDGNFT